MRFVWDNKYSVGVDELDLQHKGLFKLGNKIEDAKLCDSELYVNELLEYVRIHFKTEEIHMSEIGFPSLLEHRELHQRLVSDLFELAVVEMGEGDFVKFKLFLYSWLTKHVLKFDRRYFEYVQKQRDD